MDQSLIYILILVIVVLIMLCIGLTIMLIKVLTGKKTDSAQLDDGNGFAVYDKAQSKSQKVLEEAYTKARQIVSEADVYLKKEEGELAKAVGQAQEVYTRVYNDAIKASEEKAEKMIQSIPQDIKVTLISVIDSFRVSLTDEIKRAQSDANKVITDAYKQALESVDSYKKERLEEVDASILSIVKQVTERVLGKSLSVEEHEKLVHKALEEAKRQKIF